MRSASRLDPTVRSYLVLGVLLSTGVLAALVLGGSPAEGADHAGGGHPTGVLPREQPGLPVASDVVLTLRPGAEDETSFDPARVEVPLGAVVEIRFQNDGDVPHTLTLHDLGVDTGVVRPGETIAIRFHAERAGAFELMCAEPGHADAGMRATLVVA